MLSAIQKLRKRVGIPGPESPGHVFFLADFADLKRHYSAGGFAGFKFLWVGGNWVKCAWALSVLLPGGPCVSAFISR